jgi:hypothetical protein
MSLGGKKDEQSSFDDDAEKDGEDDGQGADKRRRVSVESDSDGISR